MAHPSRQIYVLDEFRKSIYDRIIFWLLAAVGPIMQRDRDVKVSYHSHVVDATCWLEE